MARTGLTADRITRAAADLADEAGIEDVTVSAFARSFGARTRASLYSHVRNVQDLREGVAVIAAFGDAYRECALHHPGRYAAPQIQLNPARAAASPDACGAPSRHTGCCAATASAKRT
ncbi:hypothetical protein [Streptomyces virginiae]|uniref:hypothetical protein n=1 Tax=Streptomyces virginiae TaxID=1961 RepID=UPI003F5400DC